MSETEAALFDAIVALARTLTVSGLISESALLQNLFDARRWAEDEKNRVRASVLATLIQSIGEPYELRVGADRSN